jgi:hypothetical protein
LWSSASWAGGLLLLLLLLLRMLCTVLAWRLVVMFLYLVG